jgi:hypothetical protein
MIVSMVSKITETTLSTYKRQNHLNLNELSGYDGILPVVFTDFNGFKWVIVPSTTINYSLVRTCLL